MPIPPLQAPPIRTPLVDSNGIITPAWEQWLRTLWRKTGAETNVAPLSIEGAAQTIATTQAAGSPQGVQAAPPGSFYIDTTLGTTYVKQTGEDENGWLQL